MHLDDVEGHGRFIELEVVMGPEQEPADGEKIARPLMEQLSIGEDDLVEGAYVDLISKAPAPEPPVPNPPDRERPAAAQRASQQVDRETLAEGDAA